MNYLPLVIPPIGLESVWREFSGAAVSWEEEAGGALPQPPHHQCPPACARPHQLHVSTAVCSSSVPFPRWVLCWGGGGGGGGAQWVSCGPGAGEERVGGWVLVWVCGWEGTHCQDVCNYRKVTTREPRNHWSCIISCWSTLTLPACLPVILPVMHKFKY